MRSYKQPVKERVRTRLLSRAVQLLTSQRHRTPIVVRRELRVLVDFALHTLKGMGWKLLRQAVLEELDEWLQWQSARIQRRKPEELRVIYLCGPEPLNDLRVLLELGINPHNVWAVESNEQAFQSAVSQLEKANVPVKMHRGSLAQFFERVQETFDIAYIDGTRPILGGKPSALAPVLELLRSSRLEELSVLITNFAEVPTAAGERTRYSRVLTEFFRFRYSDVPPILFREGVDPAVSQYESSHMLPAVQKNPDEVYTDFVSRLIIDLARSWIPSARGLRAIERQYLADASVAQSAVKAAYSPDLVGTSIEEILLSSGDANLSPSSYPLVSFVRALQELTPPDPLGQQLGNALFASQNALDLNKSAALLDKIIEGHWKVASEELLHAVATPWFDQKNHFSCDLPLPNLVVNSLLGIYGRPYFTSLRDSIRGKYKAKTITMYADMFVLDQCRYYFDWFPTVSQVPSRFRSIAFQVLARCLMDRIWSSDKSPDAHPFRGSSVAGFYALRKAPFVSLAPRVVWK
jgi:hypothetical protein